MIPVLKTYLRCCIYSKTNDYEKQDHYIRRLHKDNMATLGENSVLRGEKFQLPKYSTLHHMFETNLHKFSDRVGAIFDGRRVTFGQLNQRANKLARLLLKKLAVDSTGSLPNASVIAVNMHPSEKLIVALLAILKLGAAYVPLDATFPASRIVHILTDSKPLCVIVDGDWTSLQLAKNNSNAGQPIFLCSELEKEAVSEPDLNLEQNSTYTDQLACIMYTSGSTGVPKGVKLPHKVVFNRLSWQWSVFPYEDGEVGAFKTSLTFVDHISEIFAPLLKGIPFVIVPKGTARNPDSFVNLLELRGVTRIVLVPSLLRNILSFLKVTPYKTDRLKSLKLWVCSGEVLPTTLLNDFFNYFEDENDYCTLCNFYGSTEVMGDVSYETFLKSNFQQKLVNNMVPIGRPVYNTTAYIVDDQMNIVPDGKTGELVISGGNVALGYVGGKERDEGKFVPNPLSIDAGHEKLFHTGDFASVHNGTILYEGRQDSQVKVRGQRVDLFEIEVVIEKFDCVEKAVVLCHHPGEINQLLVAYCILSSASEVDVSEKLKDKLPSYMIPKIFKVNKLPLLTNGKIDRQELQRMFVASQVCPKSSEPLEHLSSEEKAVLDAVSSVIGIQQSHISLDDSFFDIGGDSANAIQTILLLSEAGCTVQIADFLNAKSLKEVVNSLCSVRKDDPIKNTTIESVTCSAVRPTYHTVLLRDLQNHQELINILADSFAVKEILTNNANASVDDISTFVGSFWNIAVDAGFSFAIVGNDGRVIGGAINFDFNDEPESMEVPDAFAAVVEVLQHAEAPARAQVAGRGRLLHNFMLGTDVSLSFQENVEFSILMEEENLRIAKEQGFDGCITVNTHAITKSICEKLMGYEVLNTYYFREHEFNGKQPYKHLSDDEHITVMAKFF